MLKEKHDNEDTTNKSRGSNDKDHGGSGGGASGNDGAGTFEEYRERSRVAGFV